VVTIPLENNYNSWAMVAFCILAFLQAPLRDSLKKVTQHRYWILSVLFFSWLCATWLWDTGGGFTIKYIESYSIFLFLPFVMTALPRLPAKNVILACYAFIAIIVIVCTTCFIKSYLEYRVTGDSRVFYYHYLGYQMGLNAVYLSNYCIASIIWLLFYRFVYQGPQPVKLSLTLTTLISIYLSVAIFFLSSKLSYALFVVMIVFMTIYIGYIKKMLYKSLLIIVIAGAAVALLTENLYYLRWRLSELEFKKYEGPQDNQNGLAVRMVTWQSAAELIKDRPVLGYGLKGAGDELVKKYREKDFQIGIPERFNSHNQYMETALRSGLIGLVVLLLLLYFPLRTGIREKKLLLVLIVLHFMLVSMVEGILEYQQELVFYWFFILLFYYHYPQHTNRQQADAVAELKTSS
jgi:O-antigen ligase